MTGVNLKSAGWIALTKSAGGIWGWLRQRFLRGESSPEQEGLQQPVPLSTDPAVPEGALLLPPSRDTSGSQTLYSGSEEGVQTAHTPGRGSIPTPCSLLLHEPAACPGCQEGQWHPGVHHKECGQQGEGGSPPPLLCPSKASSAVLCPVLGSPVQER